MSSFHSQQVDLLVIVQIRTKLLANSRELSSCIVQMPRDIQLRKSPLNFSLLPRWKKQVPEQQVLKLSLLFKQIYVWYSDSCSTVIWKHNAPYDYMNVSVNFRTNLRSGICCKVRGRKKEAGRSLVFHDPLFRAQKRLSPQPFLSPLSVYPC